MYSGSAHEILKKYISGYHEYALEAPVHISYAGESFCGILGKTLEELTRPLVDMQFPAVHPADRAVYQAFLKRMSEAEQTASCAYRLMTGGRRFRRYAVSMTSVRGEDGRMTGYGVLVETGPEGPEALPLLDSGQGGGRRPAAGGQRRPGGPGGPHVKIRTFGYFDVFVDGRPIMFRHEKAKELLALLVDRLGGFVSSEEAIGFLWEDEPASPVVLARYRKVSMRLKNLLEEYGIAPIVESVNGKRRIVPETVDCDLYAYMSQAAGFADLFNGSYLTNYSWGETTLGELLARQEEASRRR